MRSREKTDDDLRWGHTKALEEHGRLLERQTRTLQQLAETLRRPPRTRESVPRRPYRARRALTSLWQTVVPDTHVLETQDRQGATTRMVLCPCGHQTVLPTKGHQGCHGVRWHGDTLDPEGCDRWFLVRPDKVYVHRFMASAQLTAV